MRVLSFRTSRLRHCFKNAESFIDYFSGKSLRKLSMITLENMVTELFKAIGVVFRERLSDKSLQYFVVSVRYFRRAGIRLQGTKG